MTNYERNTRESSQLSSCEPGPILSKWGSIVLWKIHQINHSFVDINAQQTAVQALQEVHQRARSVQQQPFLPAEKWICAVNLLSNLTSGISSWTVVLSTSNNTMNYSRLFYLTLNSFKVSRNYHLQVWNTKFDSPMYPSTRQLIILNLLINILHLMLAW